MATIEIPDIDIMLPAEETIDDDEIPEKVKTITKMGDLWELNRHRVLCGDSTKTEQVKRLMAKNRADMVFTDPPYGIKLNADYSGMVGIGKGNKYENIKGDHVVFNPGLINTVFVPIFISQPPCIVLISASP